MSNFYFLIFLAMCAVSLVSHFSFFLYVVYGCVCTWVCRYTRMCGTLRFLLVFPSILHLIFWGGNLVLTLKITVLVRIDNHWAPGISLSPFFWWYVLDMTYANIPDFYVVVGDMNSDHHSCVANILYAEPSPLVPLKLFANLYYFVPLTIFMCGYISMCSS